jgi:hypothetical protein
MHKILGERYAKPLEREYEAWIVAGIESYLKNIGLKYAIWAIGPKQENVWPADEALSTGSKIVGLQFKRADLSETAGPTSKSNLKWDLSHPAHQFGLVKANKEVFYCLPTFINRDLRAEALHHCLFWRPDSSKPDNKNPWYENPRAHDDNPYKKISGAMRWGLFFEELMHCDVGVEVKRGADVEALTAKLFASSQVEALRKDIEGTEVDAGGRYVLVVERPV